MGRRSVVVACLAALLGAGAVVALPLVANELPEPLADVARLPERLWTRVFPPRTPKGARLEGLTGPEREAVARLAGKLDGRLVWSSNRSGNHELYLLDLGARSLRRLTNSPNVDFFGRFSPDGKQLVFLRSQRQWVSFREPSAWDVFLMELEGGQERRLARGGYHPTWTADGKAVVFHRGPRVFRYDLATGRETLLLDAEQAIPGVIELGDPELAPDGRRLALYPRGPHAGNAVFDLAARTLTLLGEVQAFQPSWAPDGQSLVWIEIEGHGGTRVMVGRPDGSGRRVLIDLPGSHSHEYFPKLANDGRWLVWGASAGGHEHDRADYEIFVWELGTPVEQAVRLTQHESNDQWPDLWIRSTR
jgi:Tol biopolymer transport system component